VGRFLAFLALLASLAIAAAWYVQRSPVGLPAVAPHPAKPNDDWLTDLYSQNPRETERAIARVNALGLEALPLIRQTLQDPKADRDRRKGALKACAVLGPVAATAVPDVAAMLNEPELTAEAAIALSFMGVDALPPLRHAITADDPLIRREALRSLGKLHSRASLDASDVMPLLLDAMSDENEGVRAVAATYLGILHEDPKASVPLLITALEDADVGVRRAAAGALGSFGGAAQPAIPALKKAMSDPDEDLVREAGRAIVKLQSEGRGPGS
jgi:HEAT repeat protein